MRPNRVSQSWPQYEQTVNHSNTGGGTAEWTETGVGRVICVIGLGAGNSRGKGGILYNAIIFPLFLKRAYDDKDVQEWIIRQSRLDLGDGPPRVAHPSAANRTLPGPYAATRLAQRHHLARRRC